MSTFDTMTLISAAGCWLVLRTLFTYEYTPNVAAAARNTATRNAAPVFISSSSPLLLVMSCSSPDSSAQSDRIRPVARRAAALRSTRLRAWPRDREEQVVALLGEADHPQGNERGHAL